MQNEVRLNVGETRIEVRIDRLKDRGVCGNLISKRLGNGKFWIYSDKLGLPYSCSEARPIASENCPEDVLAPCSDIATSAAREVKRVEAR